MDHGGGLTLASLAPLVLSSSAVGIIIKAAVDAFTQWRRERAEEREGRQSEPERLRQENAELRAVALALQAHLLRLGVDKRSIVAMPGQRPFAFLEAPTNPDHSGDLDEDGDEGEGRALGQDARP